MARIIIGDPSFISLSDEELEYYGNRFEKLCQDNGRLMTFEDFCLMFAIKDLKVFMERFYSQKIWHEEVERERRSQG